MRCYTEPQRQQSVSCKECKTTQLVASRLCDANPLFCQLHWLPERQRILYKTAVTTRKVLTTGVPAYLKEHLVRHAATRQTHVLLHIHC